MSSPSSPGPINPWQRMWTAPAATLLNMVQFGQGDAWARPLLLGAGLLSSLAPQVRAALAQMLPQNANVLGVALVSGLVLGGLQAFIWPALLQLACRWLGGQGTPRATRLAAAWSSLPVLLSYVLAPLGGSGDVADAGAALYGVVSLLLSAWTLALLVRSLGAAQRLTPFKAGLSVLLGGVLLFVALLAAGFLAALVLVALGISPQLP
ncbi:YIP1 family protein [Deinococcus irradiatisoli]|nr:YIP1 family protein [Deinococcus irradiatisoli]